MEYIVYIELQQQKLKVEEAVMSCFCPLVQAPHGSPNVSNTCEHWLQDQLALHVAGGLVWTQRCSGTGAGPGGGAEGLHLQHQHWQQGKEGGWRGGGGVASLVS